MYTLRTRIHCILSSINTASCCASSTKWHCNSCYSSSESVVVLVFSIRSLSRGIGPAPPDRRARLVDAHREHSRIARLRAPGRLLLAFLLRIFSDRSNTNTRRRTGCCQSLLLLPLSSHQRLSSTCCGSASGRFTSANMRGSLLLSARHVSSTPVEQYDGAECRAVIRRTIPSKLGRLRPPRSSALIPQIGNGG